MTIPVRQQTFIPPLFTYSLIKMAVTEKGEYRGESWLVEALIGCGAVRFGEFTLTSGRKSDYYVSIKHASTKPEILWQIALGIRDVINTHYMGAEKIAGMELGAVPIAAAVALATGMPYVMVRKGKRTHGTGGQIEGDWKEGERAVVVEDVSTTGGSILRTIDILKGAGMVVVGAVVVVDRCEGATEALRGVGYKLFALTNAKRLKEGKR